MINKIRAMLIKLLIGNKPVIANLKANVAQDKKYLDGVWLINCELRYANSGPIVIIDSEGIPKVDGSLCAT